MAPALTFFPIVFAGPYYLAGCFQVYMYRASFTPPFCENEFCNDEKGRSFWLFIGIKVVPILILPIMRLVSSVAP